MLTLSVAHGQRIPLLRRREPNAPDRRVRDGRGTSGRGWPHSTGVGRYGGVGTNQYEVKGHPGAPRRAARSRVNQFAARPAGEPWQARIDGFAAAHGYELAYSALDLDDRARQGLPCPPARTVVDIDRCGFRSVPDPHTLGEAIEWLRDWARGHVAYVEGSHAVDDTGFYSERVSVEPPAPGEQALWNGHPVVATQEYLDVHGLERHAGTGLDGGRKPAIGYLLDGVLYVGDGHHRMASDWVLGQSTEVRVADLDRVIEQAIAEGRLHERVAEGGSTLDDLLVDLDEAFLDNGLSPVKVAEPAR